MKESVQWKVICSGMMYVCGVRKQSAPETFKKMHDATKIVYIDEKKNILKDEMEQKNQYQINN